MRKLLFGLLAMLFLVGSSASATLAQDDDATPEDEGTSETSETNPIDPQVGDPITYYSEEGEPLAVFTVTGVEWGWEGYDDYSEPAKGTEYVAITVSVENLAERSSFDVSEYAFGLQDSMSHYWSTSYSSPEEELDPPVMDGDLSLEGGDTAEFTLLFIVSEDIPMGYLYYSESGQLLTLANLSERE